MGVELVFGYDRADEVRELFSEYICIRSMDFMRLIDIMIVQWIRQYI